MKTDITLYIHGLEPFIYVNTKLKKGSEYVEVSLHRHSWRYKLFLKQFYLHKIKSFDLFIRYNEQKMSCRSLSFNKNLQNIFIDQSLESVKNGLDIQEITVKEFQLPFSKFKRFDQYFLYLDLSNITHKVFKNSFIYIKCIYENSRYSLNPYFFSINNCSKYFLISCPKKEIVYKATPLYCLSSNYIKKKETIISSFESSSNKILREISEYRKDNQDNFYNIIKNIFCESSNENHLTIKNLFFEKFSNKENEFGTEKKYKFYQNCNNLVNNKLSKEYLNSLIPIYISGPKLHKIDFENKNNNLNIMGPMGTGLPFNNSSNKTYLYGNFNFSS